MRYLIAAVVFTFIHIFSSCMGSSENNLAVYKAMDEGLQQSINSVSLSNALIYRSMEVRLTDPKTSEIMKLWQPKAIKVKVLSDSMISYIYGLKEKMIHDASTVNGEDNEVFQRNKLIVKHLFESDNKGKELYEKLMNYRKDMLSVDPMLNNTFKNRVTIFTKQFDYNKLDEKEFSDMFFKNMPAIAAMAMLSKLANNVKINESNFINYCNSQMCIINFIDDYFSTINILIGQNSNYLKGGDELEITAGIGAFSSAVKSKIMINNRLIPVVNGVAVYKTKAQQKAGKHLIPIKIEYIAEDGRKEIMTKMLTYTVIE